VLLHLILLLGWHHNSAVLLASLDEADDLAGIQVLVHADSLKSSLLLGKGLIVLHPLIKLSVLVIADVHEVFLGLKNLLLFQELVVILYHV